MGKPNTRNKSKTRQNAATMNKDSSGDNISSQETPKRGKTAKRNLSKDLDCCEEQPVSKQTRNGQNASETAEFNDESQSSQSKNNNARPEVCVATAKSLINSIKKKRFDTVQQGHVKPGTSNVRDNTVKYIQKESVKADSRRAEQKHNSTGLTRTVKSSSQNGDGVDIEVNRSEDDYAEDISGHNKSMQTDDESEQESDPDLEKLDYNKNQGRQYSSSDEELDYDDDVDFEKQLSNQSSESESSSEQSSSSSEEEIDYKKLKKDPKVRRLLNELLDEKLDRERRRNAKHRKRERHRLREKHKKSHHKSSKDEKKESSNSRKGNKVNKVEKTKSKNLKGITTGNLKRAIQSIAKSPSDTTIYAPALLRDTEVSPSVLNQLKRNKAVSVGKQLPVQSPVMNVIDQISDFVDNIRIRSTERQGNRRTEAEEPGPSHHSQASDGGDDSHKQHNDAANLADRVILDAEKFKATVNAPKGNVINGTEDANVNESLLKIADCLKHIVNNDDDEFFHITSHVDSNLKAKIENGEYIELEKLIPKNRSQVLNEDRRLQLMHKNGETYLATPEAETKINSVRRWEQAFRVYSAIYSKANPERSHEIWQYIHVINTAAASYVWENVQYYDVTFRQLMHSKPKRSWAKIYSQLWNLAMCEPIIRTGGASHSSNQHRSSDKFDRNRCCWGWNKSKCNKWNCKWDHRCSSCGAFSHTYQQCHKKKNKNNGGGGGNKPNTNATTNANHRPASPKKEVRGVQEPKH